MSNRYLEAAASIPRGETRSFSELAVMAGRPGAARAAGRALRGCPDDATAPWHRVVSADGSLDRDPERARLQLRRLRREGARPRAGEGVRAWTRRVRCRLVASYARRVFLPARDERVGSFDPERVERVVGEAAAIARGFRPVGADGSPEGATHPDPARLCVPRARGKPRRTLAARLAQPDWDALSDELLHRGWLHLRALLKESECAEVLTDAGRANRFERSIVMAPRGYGVGAYHYLREPLAKPAGELRGELYARLRPAAERLSGREYPRSLASFWRRCRAAGQRRSSSIVLCYGKGGVNHPHRDIYGDEWFPFQALVPLMRRGRDFAGGELLLYEETGRGDVRHEIEVDRGDVVVFASRERLDAGGRRPKRVPLRHGMATVTRGERVALGIVFNLAS